jgi:hypothetical protein
MNFDSASDYLMTVEKLNAGQGLRIHRMIFDLLKHPTAAPSAVVFSRSLQRFERAAIEGWDDVESLRYSALEDLSQLRQAVSAGAER